MKCITFAMGEWMVYDDNLKAHDKLPPKVFVIRFSKEKGFYLKEQPDIVIGDDIYGNHISNAEKIIEGYNKTKRSMGVLFSGDKGLGKTLTTRYIAVKMMEKGMPVIIVDIPYPDITKFITEIKQEVVILLDEFEKLFSDPEVEPPYNNRDSDDKRRQNEFLTMLDGFDSQKRLYIITCNTVVNINPFLLNRPGRIHYHIRFTSPDVDTIRAYLSDKVESKYHGEIDEVVKFTSLINYNYDMLDAISFELNLGRKFKDVIDILNIQLDSYMSGEYVFIFKNGVKFTNKYEHLDMGRKVMRIDLCNPDSIFCGTAEIECAKFSYDPNIGIFVCTDIMDKHPRQDSSGLKFTEDSELVRIEFKPLRGPGAEWSRISTLL